MITETVIHVTIATVVAKTLGIVIGMYVQRWLTRRQEAQKEEGS